MENNKRRALGRGLEELFNNEPIAYDKMEEKILNQTPKEEIEKVKLSELRSNPYQPRQVFDQEALNELAASIKEFGVIQPIIIKKSIKGYEIIAGERRVKASQLAGLEEIPAIIRDFTDEEMMEIALLENLQRENLNPIEESRAYKKLIDALHLTQEELAKRLGKSRSYITNMIGLQNLPSTIQDKISENKISMGHARVLSKLENEQQQEELLTKYPYTKIKVIIDNTNNIEKLLLENKIDIGLVEGKVTSNFLQVSPYMSDKLCVICNPNHPYAQYKKLNPRILINESMIMREKGSAVRELFDMQMENIGLKIEPLWESISSHSIIQAVKENLGISILPYFIVKEYIERNEISTININEINLSRDFNIIYHKSKFHSTHFNNFIKICLNDNSY